VIDARLNLLLHAAHAVHRAFGPPGDWGYSTPCGAALFALYAAAANCANGADDRYHDCTVMALKRFEATIREVAR